MYIVLKAGVKALQDQFPFVVGSSPVLQSLKNDYPVDP